MCFKNIAQTHCCPLTCAEQSDDGKMYRQSNLIQEATPTEAPATIDAPINKLVYASRQVESKPPTRINKDMTTVEVDRRKSALTCRSAVNMFTARTSPCFLLLMQNAYNEAKSKTTPPTPKPKVIHPLTSPPSSSLSALPWQTCTVA